MGSDDAKSLFTDEYLCNYGFEQLANKIRMCDDTSIVHCMGGWL